MKGDAEGGADDWTRRLRGEKTHDINSDYGGATFRRRKTGNEVHCYVQRGGGLTVGTHGPIGDKLPHVCCHGWPPEPLLNESEGSVVDRMACHF